MFEYFRKHTRIFGFILALLIVPAFVMVGVQGYTQMNGAGSTVAMIDGKPIKQAEWDQAHRQQIDRIKSRQPDLDSKILETDAMRYATLEGIVKDKVLEASVQKLGLVASNEQLAKHLQQSEWINSFKKPDGSIDIVSYKQMLQSQGLSPESFEARVRQDLASQQLIKMISGTSLELSQAAQLANNAQQQQRQVQRVVFEAAKYRDNIKLTDEDIDDFYKTQASRFQVAEQINVEYVLLNADALSQQQSVSDGDIAAYYQAQQAQFTTKEERRARHILISTQANAPQADKDAAKTKASAVLEQIKKTPAHFAELAKKHSQDPGSASRGGDLDFFQRGAMVKAFDEAVFNMKKGDVSGLVETDFGFHIIELTDIKPATTQPLAQVKAQIEKDLRKQHASKALSDAAEQMSNLVNEHVDSLQKVAEQLKLPLRTETGVQRSSNRALPPALSHEKVMAALFAPDSLEKKQTTDVMEIGANQFVAARVKQHHLAYTRPLTEVKAQVREQLLNEKAQTMAREEGEKALATWQKDEAGSPMPKAIGVSKQDPKMLQNAEINAIWGGEVKKLPTWLGVSLGDKGYAVIKVIQTTPRTQPDAAALVSEARQYAQTQSASETLAYFNTMKRLVRTDIKVKKPSDSQ
jgi:peptidyl-prolyl cis-trans isomerase D